MIENDITRTLDQALKEKRPAYIHGLSGFGKTAIVKEWLSNHSKINCLYFDVATLKEPMGKIVFHNDLTLCGQLFSGDTIDSMIENETIAVFDNYHLANASIKQHILLLCDGFVIDSRVKNDIREVKNLDFVCVISTDML